ncbi:alpha/beta fold hydrolase [Halobacillus salinus]|uniref:Alpha/beta fold hydrolase n=1 Tax=Halobacillus salinus TaxID=192814 RepID=A0A4Z0H7C0_9BACI|nr:alpha/beta fold hydrolase [Halobacillus salinus]TGB04956.1 alpha/beta fold hydrolase [Halobacillus salinus]
MLGKREALVKEKKGYLKNEKYETYYEIHTPVQASSDSTPIILLAGGPGLSFTTLTPLLNLAEGRQVIAYDQLGSGRTTRSESFESLNIKDFTDQFSSMVRELGLNKFHLLGHSWGSILAVEVAVMFPEKTKSLILHSGIADWQKCLKERERFEEDHFPRELKRIKKKAKEGIKISEEEADYFTTEFSERFYCRVDHPDYLVRALADKDVRSNQLIWDPEWNKEVARFTVCDKLSEIKCAALVVSGRFDGLSVGQAPLFEAGIPYSQHVEFRNSSHYAHIEEQQKFLDLVTGFINKVKSHELHSKNK